MLASAIDSDCYEYVVPACPLTGRALPLTATSANSPDFGIQLRALCDARSTPVIHPSVPYPSIASPDGQLDGVRAQLALIGIISFSFSHRYHEQDML